MDMVIEIRCWNRGKEAYIVATVAGCELSQRIFAQNRHNMTASSTQSVSISRHKNRTRRLFAGIFC
jgi:hypothetical protein